MNISLVRRTRALVVGAAALATLGIGAVGASTASAMTPAQTTESGVVNLLAGTSAGSITNFWATTMKAWGDAYAKPTLYYYNTSTVGFPNTPCGKALANNAFYCSSNNSIYLDYTWNQQQLNGYGDYAAGGILAHEWGHGIQAWLGQAYDGYRSEYHADCMAGMYTHYGYAIGRLTGSDYGEMYNWLYYQAYSVGHGRGSARSAWYQYGYTQYSLAACNLAYNLPVTPAATTNVSAATGISGGSAFNGQRQAPPAAPALHTLMKPSNGHLPTAPLPSLGTPVITPVPASMR